MFREYPKMLYREDNHMIVNGKEHEDTARAEGWHDYNEQPTIKTAPRKAPANSKPAPKQFKKG